MQKKKIITKYILQHMCSLFNIQEFDKKKCKQPTWRDINKISFLNIRITNIELKYYFTNNQPQKKMNILKIVLQI